jgi:hypothetical protein
MPERIATAMPEFSAKGIPSFLGKFLHIKEAFHRFHAVQLNEKASKASSM